MKNFAKLALGALMVAGAATATTAAMTSPAEARVSVGIGLGFPGYYGGYYGPRYYGPRYYSPYAYPAYYDPYYYPGYYGPSIYFGGGLRGWHGGGWGGRGLRWWRIPWRRRFPRRRPWRTSLSIIAHKKETASVFRGRFLLRGAVRPPHPIWSGCNLFARFPSPPGGGGQRRWPYHCAVRGEGDVSHHN